MQHTLQIAIAHQNPQSRHAVHAAVAQLGHSVCVHAGTGRELIDSSQRPDLVIVQEFLPDMTGMQAVREACGDVAVPIVVVIDRNSGRLLELPDSSNVLGVLQEPVRSCDLIPLIPLVVERFERLQALRQRNELLKEALAPE